MKVYMSVSMGSSSSERLVFELFDKVCPKTCLNFATLIKTGKYKKTIFHRVIRGFMVQVCILRRTHHTIFVSNDDDMTGR